LTTIFSPACQILYRLFPTRHFGKRLSVGFVPSERERRPQPNRERSDVGRHRPDADALLVAANVTALIHLTALPTGGLRAGTEPLADAIAQIVTDGTALDGTADTSHHSLARTRSLKNQWLACDKSGGRQKFVDATLLSNTVIRAIGFLWISSMSRSF
jgi:hypothetical protein